MLVVAYYSMGTPYEAEAALLRSSLNRVGMDHYIVGVPNRGGWYANTAHKAVFLRDQRRAHKGPLLYVDVDAFVHENCAAYFDALGPKGVDFGAHWFRGPAKGHDRSKVCNKGWWMLSGTLYLGDTLGCRTLLDNWVRMNTLFAQSGIVQGGGQKNLWYLVTCMEDDLKVERLPGRYCYVFDKPWAYDEDEPVIIEHTIGSRQHRPGRDQPDAIYDRQNLTRHKRIHELREQVTP